MRAHTAGLSAEETFFGPLLSMQFAPFLKVVISSRGRLEEIVHLCCAAPGVPTYLRLVAHADGTMATKPHRVAHEDPGQQARGLIVPPQRRRRQCRPLRRWSTCPS